MRGEGMLDSLHSKCQAGKGRDAVPTPASPRPQGRYGHASLYLILMLANPRKVKCIMAEHLGFLWGKDALLVMDSSRSQLILAIIARVSEYALRRNNIHRNSAMRFFLFLFFAAPAAIIYCFFGQVYGDELSKGRPARQAQCLLEVKGTHYVGGDCLFAPLDREGSFQITAAKRIRALVKVNRLKRADVSWSGATGGDAAAVSLGSAFFNKSGCWILFNSSPTPMETTLVCAWDQIRRGCSSGRHPPIRPFRALHGGSATECLHRYCRVPA